MGDQSSGEGPCSVVSTSETLTSICTHRLNMVLTCTSVHTQYADAHTHVLWLRQWWQMRLH